MGGWIETIINSYGALIEAMGSWNITLESGSTSILILLGAFIALEVVMRFIFTNSPH